MAAFSLMATLWLISGFYSVRPEENAVVLTFGKWTATRTAPGLGYHWPYPLQNAVKVNVALSRKSDFKGTILTGDENILDVEYTVFWHVKDIAQYLFQIRDPQSTVGKVSESAMREVIGRAEVQAALTDARDEIEMSVKNIAQEVLDEYKVGIAISGVRLLRVDPPAPVLDAFYDVQRSKADKERLKNEAETYANDILPKARGEASKIRQEAEAYKEAVIKKAEGEAGRFSSVSAAASQSREVTEKRLYLEATEEALQNSSRIIISDEGHSPK